MFTFNHSYQLAVENPQTRVICSNVFCQLDGELLRPVHFSIRHDLNQSDF